MAARPARAAGASELADSEYAFQLQVQEAVRASLRSASRHPPPPLAKSAARSTTRESNDQEPNIPNWKLATETTAAPDKATAFRAESRPWIHRVFTSHFLRMQSQVRSFLSSMALRIYTNVAKFAFKLAIRDAIVSRVSRIGESPAGKNREETCAICFEDTDASEMFSVDECMHRYCFSCMKKHVEAKLNDGAAVKCPHDGCDSKIAMESCEKLLEEKLVYIMSQRMKEASVPAAERVYCPRPRCSALMSKPEVLKYSKASFMLFQELYPVPPSRGFKTSLLNFFHRKQKKASLDQCGARKCIRCKLLFCINCRVPWHYSMSCTDYRASKRNRASEDVKLKSLAIRELWRQCMNCNNMVELASGCNHITCRCGYEFCYTCGAKWMKKKKRGCKCPIYCGRRRR